MEASLGSTRARIRLTLLAYSPVYYKVPLYQRIAADPRVDFTAVFISDGGIRPFDSGYGQLIQWDGDLLAGYRSVFLTKAHKNPIGERPFWTYRDWDVVGKLLHERSDVLWLFGYNTLTHVLALGTQSATRRPILFQEEQNLLNARPLWKRAVKRLALVPMFSRNYGLYIGSQNYRWLRHYGVRAERMYFTPYCVDNDHFRREAERLHPMRLSLREEFGIPAAAGPVILTVGRLIPKKQPLLLLDAFHRVRRQRRCTLVIVGSGMLEPAIRSRIEAERIPDVVLTGFLNQSQVTRAYACADIFVLPSVMRETWGLVVNEAMNFRLPIVVTDKVGCAQDLVKEDNGYTVSSEDPRELALTLLGLVDSTELRGRLGAASEQRVQHWNYDAAAKGIVSATAAAVGMDRWSSAEGVEVGQ